MIYKNDNKRKIPELPNPDLWLKDAEECIDLANQLVRKSTKWAYFFAYHSAELSLKAILISLGNMGFKSYRHDIVKIWKEGLNKTKLFDENDIKWFGPAVYDNLRYPPTSKSQIEIKPLEKDVKKVIASAQKILNISKNTCQKLTASLDKIMGWKRLNKI